MQLAPKLLAVECLDITILMPEKPKNWREGQAVFNYVDLTYGVARFVQFEDRIDCFYDDSQIDAFIIKSVEYITNYEKYHEN